MKTRRFFVASCLLLLSLGLVTLTAAQQPARDTPKKPALSSSKESAAIGQSAAAFREAFNRGDAKAVAALWTKDGELIDTDGKRFEGRAAIEKQYNAFFAAHPGAKISLMIDAIRLASDAAAIEDGHSTVEDANTGEAGYAKYTVLHVKTDGKWSMSSVREMPARPQVHAAHLRDIDWLVGAWTATESGSTMTMDCRWVAGKSYLERSWSVTKDKQVVTSGVQIIGVNSQTGGIQSWSFTSDGGHAVGSWTPRSAGWAIQTSGLLADGSVSTATNLLSRIDDNSISWRSVGRSLGGVALPDGDQFVLKRAASGR